MSDAGRPPLRTAPSASFDHPRPVDRSHAPWAPRDLPASTSATGGHPPLPHDHSLHTRVALAPLGNPGGLGVRVRSSATIAATCDHHSHASSTPPDSPGCGSPGVLHNVRVEDARHSQQPDGVVQLRRVGGKPGGFQHPFHASRWSSARFMQSVLGLSHFQRQTVMIVVMGLLFGAALHGFVFWHGMAGQPRVNAPAQFADARSMLEGPAHRAAGARGAVSKAPAASLVGPSLSRAIQDAQKLGMPGDSDRLPHNPPWNAVAWQGGRAVSPNSPDWPNSVAICALMKSEHPDDVVQWLKYHRWIGVDKVFLRENGAAVPLQLQQRLQPFVESGFLDLGTLPGPKHPMQNRWYNRCSKPDMAGLHSWVAFIDLDEYMVVLEDGLAAKSPNLKAVLVERKGNAGLSMQWVVFGSSGHVRRPEPGGPLAHYSRCTGQVSYQMKCLANMHHATHHMMVGNTVHDCTYKYDEAEGVHRPPITLTDGTELHVYENTDMTNPKLDPALGRSRTYRGHLDHETYNSTIGGHRLVLFHYVTRSLQDYTTRKIQLPSGIYTHNYVAESRRHDKNLADAKVMARFEHANGFDGRAPICSSVQRNHYAGALLNHAA